MTIPRRLEHLLNPATFADDEPVLVAAVSGTHAQLEYEAFSADVVAERWSPERLFWRIVGLAGTYRLHRLSMPADDGKAHWFNPQQVDGFTDELRFIAAVVVDPAVEAEIREVDAVVRACVECPDAWLVIEGG